MIPEETKKLFISKYNLAGNDKFYDFLITYASNRIDSYFKNKGLSPETELFEYYEKFLFLFRKEEDPIYLDIARQFRRAAHKIYRIMLNKNLVKISEKFLNTV